MDKRQVKLSKFLSLVLRHNPSAANVVLNRSGWIDVDELLNGLRSVGWSATREELFEVVSINDKQRFSIDGNRIRANQGHSIDVNLELSPLSPPACLYHGTATRFIEPIKSKGLIKGNRQYVHLSKDVVAAEVVGRRHGKAIVLSVASGQMSEAGYQFFCSDNGVWLTEYVPWDYIAVLG